MVLPNWFRWLLIVIATLILCACRAPFQDQSSVKSILVNGVEFPVDGVPQGKHPLSLTPHPTNAGQSLSTRLATARRQPEGRTATRSTIKTQVVPRTPPNSKASNVPRHSHGPILRPQAALNLDTTAIVDPGCAVPIVVKQGDRIHTYEPNTTQPVRQAPIYFHIDDSTLDADSSSVKQAQAIQPDLGSPFADDPITPEPVAVPHEVLIVDPDAFKKPTTSLPTVPSAVPIVDEQAVPLAPEHANVFPNLPAPYDFVPQESCPVDVPLEEWASEPCETIPFGDLSARYPDEYICDGGDAAARVRVANRLDGVQFEPGRYRRAL